MQSLLFGLLVTASFWVGSVQFAHAQGQAGSADAETAIRDIRAALYNGTVAELKGEPELAEQLLNTATSGLKQLSSEHPEWNNLEARSMVLRAGILIKKNEFQAAREQLDSAREIYQQSSITSPTDMAELLGQLAAVETGLGNWDRAVPFLEEASKEYEQDMPASVDDLLGNMLALITTLGQLGRYEESQALVELATEQAMAHPSASMVLKGGIFTTRAVMANKHGDYDAVVRFNELAADSLGTSPTKPTNLAEYRWLPRAWANHYLSRSFSHSYRHEGAEALATARQALNWARRNRNDADAVFALLALSTAHSVEGSVSDAVRVSLNALDVVEDHPSGGVTHLEPMVAETLGHLYLQSAQADEAEAFLRRAKSIYEERGDFRSTVGSLTSLGLLLSLADEPKRRSEGVQLLERATEIGKQFSPRMRWTAEWSLAFYYAREQRFEESQQRLDVHAELVLEDAAKQLGSTGRDPVESNLFYRKVLQDQVALEQYLPANQGQNESRLIFLLHNLKGAAQRYALGQTVEGLTLNGEQTVADVASATVSLIRGALPARSAVLDVAITSFTPVEYDGDIVDRGQRYIGYLLTSDGELASYDLGSRSTVDGLIDQYRVAVGSFSDQEVREKRMFSLLMAPILRDHPDLERLFVVPEGKLWLFPMEVLRAPSGVQLVDGLEISYLMSTRDLLTKPASTAPAADRQSIVFTNPAYPKETAGPWFRLPASEEEAKIVSTYFPATTILTGNDATETSLKKIESPLLLHIAAHGFVSLTPAKQEELSAEFGTRAPRVVAPGDLELPESGLVLSEATRPSSEGEDGYVNATEIAQLKMSGTKLAVLSACNTGVGDVAEGIGVAGLQRALAIAGVETQVVALWPVADRATQTLMGHYYRLLAEGLGRSQALQQAKREMRRDSEWALPLFWAGFVSYGRWESMDSSATERLDLQVLSVGSSGETVAHDLLNVALKFDALVANGQSEDAVKAVGEHVSASLASVGEWTPEGSQVLYNAAWLVSDVDADFADALMKRAALISKKLYGPANAKTIGMVAKRVLLVDDNNKGAEIFYEDVIQAIKGHSHHDVPVFAIDDVLWTLILGNRAKDLDRFIEQIIADKWREQVLSKLDHALLNYHLAELRTLALNDWGAESEALLQTSLEWLTEMDVRWDEPLGNVYGLLGTLHEHRGDADIAAPLYLKAATLLGRAKGLDSVVAANERFSFARAESLRDIEHRDSSRLAAELRLGLDAYKKAIETGEIDGSDSDVRTDLFFAEDKLNWANFHLERWTEIVESRYWKMAPPTEGLRTPTDAWLRMYAHKMLNDWLGVADYYIEYLSDPSVRRVARKDMKNLNDLRSEYRDMVSRFRELISSDVLDPEKNGAIGVRFRMENGAVFVEEVVSGLPAEQEGLKSGDRIVAIDGRPIGESNADSAAEQLGGPADTQVMVTVVHGDGAQEIEKHIVLTRVASRIKIEKQFSTLTRHLIMLAKMYAVAGDEKQAAAFVNDAFDVIESHQLPAFVQVHWALRAAEMKLPSKVRKRVHEQVQQGLVRTHGRSDDMYPELHWEAVVFHARHLLKQGNFEALISFVEGETSERLAAIETDHRRQVELLTIKLEAQARLGLKTEFDLNENEIEELIRFYPGAATDLDAVSQRFMRLRE